MKLTKAFIGPFRSIEGQQTLNVDPKVTVLVGMNEAGKTVLLKALQKSNCAVSEDKFDPTEDYPRKNLTAYKKVHATDPASAVVLEFELDAVEIAAINKQVGTSLKVGHALKITHKHDNSRAIDLVVDQANLAFSLSKNFSTDASNALKDCKDLREFEDKLASVSLTPEDQTALAAIKTRIDKTEWHNVAQWEAWRTISTQVPKFLYFSDYDLLPGKMNLADLAQRVQTAKSDPKTLKSNHRAVLALLRMADISENSKSEISAIRNSASTAR